MIYLYGAGGHGLVIQEILQSVGRTVLAFIDDSNKSTVYGGMPVIRSKDLKIQEGSLCIVSIGSNARRREVVNKLKDYVFATAIHKAAIVASTAKIGPGTVVMAGAILNPHCVIGKHCIINTSASVDHECIIGDFVHISPNATLCGNVKVGDNSWVAAGATIIPNITIGKNVVVGAGSVVIRDTPDNCTVVGNPARIIKNG